MKKERNRNNLSETGVENGDGTSPSAETISAKSDFVSTAQTSSNEESPLNGPTVDTSTGEMNGAGYESTNDNIDLDVVALPKKIVAKEIVGRNILKCSKKFIPELDASGNPKFDAETRAPKGTWEVSPPLMLYTVFGTAAGTESGETQYGSWIGFEGTFEALRTADGKRFKSNRLILQEPAQSLLLRALQDIKQRDAAGSITFAFNVGRRTSQRWVDTNEGNSYEFFVESVINVAKHDPLAHLRNAILPHLPRALAAPQRSDLIGSASTPESK